MEPIVVEAAINDNVINNFVSEWNDQLSREGKPAILDDWGNAKDLPWEVKTEILGSLASDLIDNLNNIGLDELPKILVSINDSVIFNKETVGYLILLIRINMSPDWVVELEWEGCENHPAQRYQVPYFDPLKSVGVTRQSLEDLRIDNVIH